MASSRSHNARQSLHLSIDPSPYKAQQLSVSPDSGSPSSSNRVSIATSHTSPTSGESDWIIYSVLCLYDFESADRDHLPFTRNEILDIVKQEESGWWAAVRPGGRKVGWIPKAFVQPLSDDMAERLRKVQKNLRVFEYEAERLYESAPISDMSHLYDGHTPLPTAAASGYSYHGPRVRLL